MDLSSGLFALGGVALAGVLTETRAWRDLRTRRETHLSNLRRETYTRALRQIETVAGKLAQWIEAGCAPGGRRPVWDALTTGYELVNEVRLIAGTPATAEALHRMLDVYRTALEEDAPELPQPAAALASLVAAFRSDLGL